jgi:hypothetical protein
MGQWTNSTSPDRTMTRSTILPPLSIDQKWSMVENDERLRWKDEKTREEQVKKIFEQSRNGMIEERSLQSGI